MHALRPRLAVIAGMIPAGKIPADIGTDHAYLPIFLVQSGKAPRAIATEVSEGSFRKARRRVNAANLETLIEVRLGWGLQPLEPGEADVIIVAGMGGHTIVNVLDSSGEVALASERLVLNPNGYEAEVREWLAANGWRLDDEDLALERGRYYQVICACPGTDPAAAGRSRVEMEIGPVLLEKRHPLLKEYVGKRLKKYKQVVETLEANSSPSSAKELTSLREKLSEWERICRSL